MVNETSAKISAILDVLKDTAAPVSGEALAENIGVSRVAVWKIISGLREKGYDIKSGRSGYMLVSSADKPLPWEIAGDCSGIDYYEQLDSTMAKAALLLENDCKDGTIVIAGSQTAGITYDGRRWKSPEGGLYFTRIRKAPFPASFCGLYTLALCSAAADVLRDRCGIEAGILWPTGICVINSGSHGARGIRWKKLGGILIQVRGVNGYITSAAAGIGLNVNTDISLLPEGATSAAEVSGRLFSIKNLAADLLESIGDIDRIFPSQIEKITEHCDERMPLKGRKITAQKTGGIVLSGKVRGLNKDGSLRIITNEGTAADIFSGEIISYE